MYSARASWSKIRQKFYIVIFVECVNKTFFLSSLLQFFALLAPLTPKLRLPLKLSHGSAMVVSMAMDLVLDMVDMADTVWDTAMARGQLTLRPMPGTDMVASTAMDSQPMADMAMAVTATARGRLRLSHGTDMAVFMATDSQPMVATPMASKDLD